MAAYKDYIKEKKEEFKQKRKLLPFKDFNLLRTPSYKALQEKRFKRLLARVNENSNEKKLYEDYLKIVKASFKADNKHQKFSLNHVEQLGISHDILFLYSKKDVGKT